MNIFYYVLVWATFALSQEILRAYELVLIRDANTQSDHLNCTYLTIRETQRYRGLPDAGYLRSSILHTGEEHIHYIARDVASLWARAENLCHGSRNTWGLDSTGGLIEGGLTNQLQIVNIADQTVLYPRQMLAQPPRQGPGLLPQVFAPGQVEPLFTAAGDPSNRVDLVFFADGYTAKERAKFLDDAHRLADGITNDQTFHTMKPLLNFWAVFSPSQESGIGRGGVPKNTVFGLYREGTELRAVYCGKPAVARAACFALGYQCDYPILVGYLLLTFMKGLEGDITTITPSLANGALVLRHELGHSIIGVGEEYDGALAGEYFGANAAKNATLDDVPWAHWLPGTSRDTQPHPHTTYTHPVVGRGPRIERSVMPMQAYPWALLNTSAPWSITFNSSGTYTWHLVRFSLSGIPEKDDLRVELDDENLGWVPRINIGVDRWHYDIKLKRTLTAGPHELRFTLLNGAREGAAQLCNVEVLEFGDESEFVAAPGHYGLYPTYSDKNETSYRPTNEDCLMRIVTTPNFCKPCTEGLWHALLRRVDLIDDLRSGCKKDSSGGWVRTLNLDLVPLAHLRERPVDVEESYIITWAKDGRVVEEFTNKTELVDTGDAVGSYVVNVRYVTEEVRLDKDGLLSSTAVTFVATTCV
ncbi:IgA peptidase M64-domain-containing protein [Trametes meyenii]|nr:IgA peptidase M64-domain-containing protein [Trametes meyenii]